MNDNHVNKYFMQWVVPGSILMVTIIFLLLRFSVLRVDDEREQVEKRLKLSAQSYAVQIDHKLEVIQNSADMAAIYMGQLFEDEVDRAALLAAVNAATGTYETVICTGVGTGYRLNGENVDLRETSYIKQVLSGGKQILYTADDGFENRQAIVVSSPIYWYHNVTGYVLCYYDTQEFEKQFRGADFGTGAFYLLMEKSGQVVAMAGNADNPFRSQSDNYFTFLKQNLDNKKQTERMYMQIRNNVSGICYATLENDSRGIVYINIGDKDFSLLIGVSEKYIDKVTRAGWATARTMVWQIIVLLVAFIGAVIVINIVTKIRENEKSRQLADKADTDLLTGLYNKVATERKIKEHLAAHPDQKGVLYVLDIDNFKKINDTLGHAFGDEVLHTLGIQISAEFRATDILGRTGGDEFTIYLCNMKEEAAIMAESARLERFFQNFQAGEYVKYSATASIGAAVFPRDAKDFEGLYKAADHALYVAKKRGKNQLAFYGDDK